MTFIRNKFKKIFILFKRYYLMAIFYIIYLIILFKYGFPMLGLDLDLSQMLKGLFEKSNNIDLGECPFNKLPLPSEKAKFSLDQDPVIPPWLIYIIHEGLANI